jgi:hypothetical protein
MALASADFHTGRGYGGGAPNLIRLFSVSSSEETEEAEEAPTFGRDSLPFQLRIRVPGVSNKAIR